MKRCPDCSLEKPSTEWNLCIHTKDKLQAICRKCQAVRRAEGLRAENMVERARVKERDLSLAEQGKHFCLLCKLVKSVGEFWPSPHGRSGLRAICKLCYKPQKREARLKSEYGLSSKAFEEMSDIQGGQCKICKKVFANTVADAYVDHDHKTGEVRGLLCSKCNVGLGHFDDSPERLRAAANYLDKVK